MIYEASPIKRKPKRSRRTKEQMRALRAAIHDLARDHQVCTVRHIYYLGIGQFWEKDAGGKRKSYNDVVKISGQLREAGILSWDWISDNTRWVRQPNMYRSANQALDQWIGNYRRDLWAEQPRNVEVWCESDSIAGVIAPITSRYGLGLYVCRGQASKSFVREAAEAYRYDGRPAHVIYAGDWDPSGLAIEKAIEERMHQYAGKGLDLTFQRVGVTAADVHSGRFISHASNKADSNFRRFKQVCIAEGLDPDLAVEVEAIPPYELKARIEQAIEAQMDATAWLVSREAENSERQHLRQMKSLMEQIRHD